MKTRGIRNNNPFNIIYVKSGNSWLGKKLPNSDGRFEQFTEMDYGVRAGIVLFRNYIKHHHLYTARQMLRRFAPSSENDLTAYYNFLTRFGVCLDEQMTYGCPNFWYFLRGICLYESKYQLSDYEIARIVKQFKLY